MERADGLSRQLDWQEEVEKENKDRTFVRSANSEPESSHYSLSVLDKENLLEFPCYDSEPLTRSNCDRNLRQSCILSSPPTRGSS